MAVYSDKTITAEVEIGDVDVKDPCKGTQTHDVKVTLDGETVGISGSVLPTGAATSANQTVQITAEQAIQTAAEIVDDWDESDRAKINPIVGQAGVAGNTGTRGATTQRVTIATDDESVGYLLALSQAIATHLGASPSKALMSGFQVVSGVPTEETAGDIASPWMDTYRRLVIAGYDSGLDALRAYVINSDPIPFESTWTALTEAGSTAVIDVSNYFDITIKVVVSGINTSVDYKLEGSVDGTNFWDMKDTSNELYLIQKTANGTYHHFYSTKNDTGKYANWVKFTFSSEVGGTDVTLTSTIYARS